MDSKVVAELLLGMFSVPHTAHVTPELCEPILSWVKSWDTPRRRFTSLQRLDTQCGSSEYYGAVAEVFCRAEDRQIMVELLNTFPGERDRILTRWQLAERDGGWRDATTEMVAKILTWRDTLAEADKWNREFPKVAPQVVACTEEGLRAAITDSFDSIERWQVDPDSRYPSGQAQTFYLHKVLAARVRAYGALLNVRLLSP